jgi:hypothetical protein
MISMKQVQTEHNDGASADESSVSSTVEENKRRSVKRRIIDETLLGEDEARKLESRRAYNRKCAAKARKRSKDLISQLQDEVNKLNQDKATLERTNEVMQARLKLLEQQNQTLMLNQRQTESLLLSGMPSTVPGSLLGSNLPRSGLIRAQGDANLSAAALLESLSQRERILASQLVGNGLLSQQFQGVACDQLYNEVDLNKRLR